MCSTPDQLPQRISVRGPVPDPGEKGLSPLTIHALYVGPDVTEKRADSGWSYGCWTLYESVYVCSPAVGPVGLFVGFDGLGLALLALGLGLGLACGVGEPLGAGSLALSSGRGLSDVVPAAVLSDDCPLWTIRATTAASATIAAPIAVMSTQRLPPVPARCPATRSIEVSQRDEVKSGFPPDQTLPVGAS
jgi:hypothetical protein